MTLYQLNLIDQAKEYWQRGDGLPLDLFANMAAEGMDVPALEARHREEPK